MITEEPPFIDVGADVSAKFKGAFCEATVKATKKLVKCKVLLKNGSSCISNDENIDGPLKLNALVRVKQQENEYAEGTIVKMTDNSLYTVVFDDGDEKTLRRTSLCLKGERHFQEDENLDNRPLNNPENFGAPVPRQRTEKSRKRTRLSSQNSLDEEEAEELAVTTPKKKRESSFGKVFCVELGERRKSWFPALCLHRSMAEGLTVEKDQMFIQSFKDGKKICVNKSDVKEFSKEREPLLSYMRGDIKIDPILRAAIEKALMFYDHGELPRGWQVDLTENTASSSEEEDSIDEEIKPTPEEDVFLSKLYSLMEEQGTPITKPPILGWKAVSLFKLYQLVMKNGGMDEVTNLSKWRSIYLEMGLTNPPTTASYNIRNFYKRYLYPFEELERDPDVSVARKITESEKEGEKDKEKAKKSESDSENENNSRRLTRMQSKNESDSEIERRETRSSKPRRSSVEKSFGLESTKSNRPTASSTESSDESTGSSAELEAVLKREENDGDSDQAKHSEGDELVDIVNSPQSSIVSEKDFSDAKSEGEVTMTEDGRYPIGAKVLVKYGKGKTHRAYEAKVIDVDMELTPDLLYYVHYRGWNHRYDEWIKHDIITGLSPTPFKKKNGNNSKNSSSSSRYKHDTPPGAHGVRLSSPVSKPRGPSPSLSTRQAVHSPSSAAKHGASSPSSRQRTSSPPLPSRQTSRSNLRRSSPPPLQPAASLPPSAEKPTKSTHTAPKPAVSASKSPHAPQKVSSAPTKAVNTPSKPPHAAPKPASLPKAAYSTPKGEPASFGDIKAHPVKPRTTRNSMQDVFLITALEESISAKGGNGRRKGSPYRGPDSPSNENYAPQRLRRARDKPNHSPIPEEEHSDSSSAKEDDVEMPEQNRTPQQKKSNRRKRKDRSPFEKEDSKESAEDDESINEYRTQSWRERSKNSPADKSEGKSKNLERRPEKNKASKTRLGNAKSKLADESKSDIKDDAMHLEIADLMDVGRFVENDEIAEDELIDTSDDTGHDAEEVSLGMKDNERNAKKRRGDQKHLPSEKHPVNVKDDAVIKKEQNNTDELMTEEGDGSGDANQECNESKESKLPGVDGVKFEADNNNIQAGLPTELPNAEEIIGMERVVDILQQAAAINAEKERNLKREVKSSPASHATPEKDRERRRKRKERKRRKRLPSCTLPDVSESESSLQSPVKDQTCQLGKEKFDFVSDLGDLGSLEASERIRVIQGRIYEIQKLYGKLKTELASIERRKRRKLRKQVETGFLTKIYEGGDSKTTIARL